MAKLSANDLQLTIGELSAKVRSREISAADLAEAFSDALDKRGATVSLRKAAKSLAKDADGDIKRERFRGPIQGIPYVVGDQFALKGRTGAGLFEGEKEDEDAHAIQRLSGNYGILIGTVARSARPADAALFELNTDDAAGILAPAIRPGATVFRPTFGMVSRYGVTLLSWSIDRVHVVCRSAEDCGIVLHEIAHGDVDDPSSAGRGFAYAPQYAKKPDQLTVGYMAGDFGGAMQPALAAMKQAGFKLAEVAIPDFPHDAVADTIVSAESASLYEDLARSGKVQPGGYAAGMEIPAVDYLRAMRIRTLIQQAWSKLFFTSDLYFAPAGKSGITAAAHLAGIPGMTLPCGAGQAAVLLGRPWFENQVIAAGRAFQGQGDWHRLKT